MARELGVDINQVVGTSEGGRISTEDVKAYAKRLVEGGSRGGAGEAEPLPGFSGFGPGGRGEGGRAGRRGTRGAPPVLLALRTGGAPADARRAAQDCGASERRMGDH